MRVVDEKRMETLHLYVVPEDQLPPKRDILAIFMIIFSCLVIIGISAISILASSPRYAVSFPLNIQGFALALVTKTIQTNVTATGRQYVPAATATGRITFYNGAVYPQIIPINTILKGADGVSVITDAQATIPAAIQTIPPTYGRVRVPAHAETPGAIGNITAGDINQACCVTSVIAQNASFHGGKDAYTYLSNQDIQNAQAPLLPTLQAQTLSILTTPQLNPTCSTVTTSTPHVGKETLNAVLRIMETCKAFSYHMSSVKDAISVYSRHFGKGTLTHVQFAIVGIKGVLLTIYVTATLTPAVMRHFYTGK
jgi:hypothetical protein